MTSKSSISVHAAGYTLNNGKTILSFFEDIEYAWKMSNGFNDKGFTYVLNDYNTYEIREILKNRGFIYDAVLNWHTNNPNINVSDLGLSLVKINFNDIYIWDNNTQTPKLKAEAEKILQKRIKSYNHLLSNSNYVGEIKDTLPKTLVHFVKKTMIRKGFLYYFEDTEENVYRVFKPDNLTFDCNSVYWLKGIIVDHQDCNGVYTNVIGHATILTTTLKFNKSKPMKEEE